MRASGTAMNEVSHSDLDHGATKFLFHVDKTTVSFFLTVEMFAFSALLVRHTFGLSVNGARENVKINTHAPFMMEFCEGVDLRLP